MKITGYDFKELQISTHECLQEETGKELKKLLKTAKYLTFDFGYMYPTRHIILRYEFRGWNFYLKGGTYIWAYCLTGYYKKEKQ